MAFTRLNLWSMEELEEMALGFAAVADRRQILGHDRIDVTRRLYEEARKELNSRTDMTKPTRGPAKNGDKP